MMKANESPRYRYHRPNSLADRGRLLLLWVVMVSSLAVSGAQEIGFVERFALADDRTQVLKDLIPGTEDYYYYHALHYQNQGDRANYEEILKQWRQRMENSAGREMLENRQALLDYGENPEETLEYLKKALGVRFDHQRERREVNPDLPTALDPSLIAMEAIVRESLSDEKTIGEVSSEGIDWLMRHWGGLSLSVAQKREVLARLERPDYEALVPALLEDLQRPESRGFGEFPVHGQLLLGQLDALAEGRPELLSDETFVLTKLGKLRPGDEVDLQRDSEAKRQYLERAWAFVSELGPAFHSLQANVLYALLRNEQERGVYDREKFLVYLQLPRPVFYVNPRYQENLGVWRHPVDLNFEASDRTGLPPIREDESLVREFLLHFLTGEEGYDVFLPYVKKDYLAALQAEANIVAGIGDPERWSSQLDPAAYQVLRDRVDLEFDPTCKEHFSPGELVTLEMHVKNVEALIVKIYEINTANYYREFGRELNTDLDLDGLIPNEELAFRYEVNPFLRVKREFRFPQLESGRGAWVLEFIGNGKSSRAVIFRGELDYLARQSSAGHVLRLIDEGHQAVPEGYVWMEGRRFDPNERGEILIPFSNNPGLRPVVLHDGKGFASLDTLLLEGENYGLDAGFHVAREELLGGREATLAVRPRFVLNGEPADLKLLEEVVLTLTSRDLDGVESTRRVEDFELFADRESLYRFRVPERLAALEFGLEARVKPVTGGDEVALAAGEKIQVNGFWQTDEVADLYLRKTSAGYQVQLLGRAGEPLPDRAINVNVRRDDFRTDVRATLRTDAAGEVQLGGLEGIYRVTAEAPNGREYRWVLPRDRRLYPDVVHASSDEVIELPLMGDPEQAGPVSLLEVSHGTFIRQMEGSVQVADGVVRLRDVPAGTYALFLPDGGTRITVRVSAGEEAFGYLLGQARYLEKHHQKDLQMEPLRIEGDELVIRVSHVNAFTRIHLLASHYVQPFEALESLGYGPRHQPRVGWTDWDPNLYVSGRLIGDEYRYILERRYADKYPGNMLERPKLLLNPWAMRDTSTEKEEAQAGDRWEAAAQRPEGAPADAAASKKALREEEGENDPHALEFLAYPGVSVYNLEPGDGGEIRVPLAELGDCVYVKVVAVDPVTATVRHLAYEKKDPAKVVVQLEEGLHPKRHFRLGNEITILQPGEPFVIDDAASASFEVYEDLAGIYRLLGTLSGGAGALDAFAFLLEWPGLEDERKRALYSEFASHELNFFLSRKDPGFFQEVVAPYLANKKDKKFMDHYLLGESLEAYGDPWSFGQLNAVERVLFADRLEGEREMVKRDLQDWMVVLPPGPEEALFFDTALAGKALQVYDFADGAVAAGEAGALSQRNRSLGVDLRLPQIQVDKEALEGMEKDAAQVELQESRLGELRRKQEAAPAAEAMFGLADETLMEDRRERESLRPFYQEVETTKEWAENHYYELPLEEQDADLILPNAFWLDFASRDRNQPFLSKHITEVRQNFTEILLALAVLDLPVRVERAAPDEDGPRKEEGQARLEDGKLTLNPAGHMILFHKELREAAVAGQESRLLVSQHFYGLGSGDASKGRRESGGEFLAGVVYGSQVVVTNPTSSAQKLDLLVQVPVGSIPVKGGKITQQFTVNLGAYETHAVDYFFYFPKPGEFQHFPVHVAQGEEVVAFADPFVFQVVDQLSKTETTSWAYVSQWGTAEEVLTYLREHNLRQTDLARIAWRLRESAAFFDQVVSVLRQRYVFDEVIYSYALYHGKTEALRQYLYHQDAFLERCGEYLQSELVVIDPVVRRDYQHLEYYPLINARTYALGGTRRILNDRFREQYHDLMVIFSQKPELSSEDQTALTVYLLFQDRVKEALAAFAQTDPAAVETKMQWNYLKAYLAFYQEDPETARQVAEQYADHPVDRWQARFAEMLSQLDEIQGRDPERDEREKEMTQEALAATEPSLSFTIEGSSLHIVHRNVESIEVRYYPMDLEFLFSSNPFMGSENARFSMIKAHRQKRMDLEKNGDPLVIPIPAEYLGQNVLIEVVGGGLREVEAHYSNQLHVRLASSYGHLQVMEESGTGRSLSEVYVKVYAEIDGQSVFYKDGYTDLRGKFDYASLSTREIDRVQRFSILVMSPDHGSVVMETRPPQR